MNGKINLLGIFIGVLLGLFLMRDYYVNSFKFKERADNIEKQNHIILLQIKQIKMELKNER